MALTKLFRGKFPSLLQPFSFKVPANTRSQTPAFKMNNQHPTKYLKLPFQFDENRLVHDLSLILENKWIPHFNTSGYNGEWNVVPLYSNNGEESNIFAYPSVDSKIQQTSIIKKCSYFKEVIESFKFSVVSARLLRLGVGTEIKPHRDHELGYEDNNFRLHIPVVTNSNVRFILDGELLKMQPGECWYTNVNYIHSVSNQGSSDRIHLVIDGVRNEWSDNLFFSLAPATSFTPVSEEIESPETIQQIINELERSKEPASRNLIIELRKKLL